tara:strand:+ start:807 stop:1142 length:336 start_codon:yes stop_codon:yes gene_type:complete
MPSDIAKQIVDRIFGDEKSKAIDLTNDALSASTYDAIQQKKIEFAKSMGFELDDTAQDSSDEVTDQLPDGTETDPETVEVDGRQPEDPPESESELETTDTPEEETTDETDQ